MKLLCKKDFNYKIDIEESPHPQNLQLFFNANIVKFKKGKVYKAKYLKGDTKFLNFKRYKIVNKYNQEVVLIEFIFSPYFNKIPNNQNNKV